MQCLAIIAVETFHDSIHDVLEDLGCEKHGVLCSELNESFKSSIRVKSECISAITTNVQWLENPKCNSNAAPVIVTTCDGN